LKKPYRCAAIDDKRLLTGRVLLSGRPPIPCAYNSLMPATIVEQVNDS
jgi:hypothetical protein